MPCVWCGAPAEYVCTACAASVRRCAQCGSARPGALLHACPCALQHARPCAPVRMCTSCRRAPAENNKKSLCQSCAEQLRIKRHVKYVRHKLRRAEANMCYRCPAPPVPGQMYCLDCSKALNGKKRNALS